MKHFLKRIYLALFLLLHISGVTFSQNPTTCRGSGITTEPAYEVTPAEIAQFDAEWLAYAQTLGLSEADKLAPSSAAYNCHGYAWHMREGNANPVWINNASGTLPNGCHGESHTIDKYWTDGCFIAVCLERDADKVHYYCGDHSAVASIAAPGKTRIKMGQVACGSPHPWANPLLVKWNSVLCFY